MPDWVIDIAKIVAVGGLIFAFGKWVGGVNADRDRLDKRFNALTKEVRDLAKEIRDDIKTILGRLPPTFAAGASPMTLTALGRKASKILDARTWAEKWSGDLVSECEGLKEYEIYERCRSYVMDDKSRWPENMAECAYEFGSDQNSLATVPILVLRDVLLERVGSR